MSSPSKVFSDDHSLWIPNSSFHGAKSMLSFENDTKLTPTATVSFFKEEPQRDEEEEENENENDDMELEAGGGGFGQKTTPATSNKKRRLSTNQVSFLEKSFEVENKLEPERKVQLAKELGLLPRQVAIWFQNRRARFKTKQLERDYDALRASFDSLKADYDNLLQENDTLKTQINSLKEKLAEKEKGKECLLEMENAIVMKAASEAVSNAPISVCKQEDASSAKSDVFDSSSDDSPHYAENNYTLFLEPADSSHVFEPEQSDFSQDDDDDLIMRKSFLAPSPFLPKIEACYYDDPPSSSCNLEFAVEDQPFNFWPY